MVDGMKLARPNAPVKAGAMDARQAASRRQRQKGAGPPGPAAGRRRTAKTRTPRQNNSPVAVHGQVFH